MRFRPYSLLVMAAFLCVAVSAVAQDKTVRETSAYKGIQPYTQPGIVSYKAGRWIGNDQLYNLSENIRVVVETDSLEGVNVPLKGDLIRSRVETTFRKSGINPFGSADGAEAVLPFVHILLITRVTDGQLATGIYVRLFEAIKLGRVQVEGGVVWQGITWEKQGLVVGTAETLEEMTSTALDEILGAFIKRFLFYQKLKGYLEREEG